MSTTHSMPLEQLLESLSVGSYDVRGPLNPEIKSITWDYQQVVSGCLYFCLEKEEFQEEHIRGTSLDHWNDAVQAGASCLIVERGKIENPPAEVTVVEVNDLNRVMAMISSAFYGDPLAGMSSIGITGTNGKTTTTQLIDSILVHAGKNPGIIGTIGTFFPSGVKEGNHLSNPLAPELYEMGAQMKKEKVDTLVMEVTSHGMAFDRTCQVDFDVAVFTNLTQDHLDYHKTFEAYKEAKLKHFKRLGSLEKKGYGIVNIDDVIGSEFVSAVESSLLHSGKVQIITYGIKNKDADLVAYPKQMTGNFSEFDVFLRGDFLSTIRLPMPGLFNIYNALAAFGATFAVGISIEEITEGLRKARQVNGRFEQVECDEDYNVYIDYAHTPDSLEKILKEVRKVTSKKLIVVFGCGGDRDRTKRPLMGEIAGELADICIVTADNPRTEDPEKINLDIVEGMSKMDPNDLFIEVDRREAIYRALEMASSGDSVLVAGKGHETYQIIGAEKYDFSDRSVVREFFQKPENEYRRAWIEIDTAILRENLKLIFEDKPKDLKVAVVVKDNALGHGMIEVAEEAVKAGCNYLAVACLSEALRIRRAGLDDIPILVFGERMDDELDTCIRHDLTVQVQSFEKARLLGELAMEHKKTALVHFKVDTGMGRYGVRYEEAVSVFKSIVNLPGIEVEGIMTHFAQSDELKKDYANKQWERFQGVIAALEEKELLPPIVHTCNSGGFLDLPHTHCTMVRLGTLPLGVYPSKVCRRIEDDGKTLRPVMKVLARVAFIKDLSPGDCVGYGMHFEAEKKMKVAVLPFGYGDGYPRLRNRGHVLIRGQEAPIVGGNGMDGTMVRVDHIPNVRIGDEVVLLGKQKGGEVTATMLADWASTVTYDVISRWSERMDRRIL